MLKYKYIRVLFWLGLIALLTLCWCVGLPLYYLLVLVIPYLAITIYGSSVIEAGYYVRSLCHGDIRKKQIAISFDDGPAGQDTIRILDILKNENVPAAFFVIGKNVAAQTELMKQIDAEGHIIGNHSFSHTFWFSMKSAKDMLADIKRCDEEICQAIGKKPRLFRPPYGVTNPMVAKAINKGEYQSIGWSLRTFDTVAKDRDKLLQRTVDKLRNSDVVLFHDRGVHTVDILTDFIHAARAKQFEIKPLDELLGIKAYL